MNNSRLWRQVACECFLTVALIGIGVGLRFACLPWPNFSPVAGLALLAGVLLHSRVLAVLVPLGIMLASDQFLSGYELPVMVSVYGCFLLPVMFGRLGRRWLDSTQNGNGTSNGGFAWRSLAVGAGSGLASSVSFFLITNAVYWASFEMGRKSVLACYVDAIPFFKYTIAGDVMFGVLFMGCLAIATAVASRRSSIRVARSI